MITEAEKLEVLQDELKEKENLEYEILNKKILNKKIKTRRIKQQRKFIETEYNYPIIRENYNSNRQFCMED